MEKTDFSNRSGAMDGKEFYQTLRDSQSPKNIPVVFLTGEAKGCNSGRIK